MSTINVDYEDLREGDYVVLKGASWEASGKVRAPWGILFLGPLCITPDVLVTATREAPDPPTDLPTEPGAYADKDGDAWLVNRDGKWAHEAGDEFEAPDKAWPGCFGPFTPLRPESEVRAEVEAEIAKWLRAQIVYANLAGRVERGEYR